MSDLDAVAAMRAAGLSRITFELSRDGKEELVVVTAREDELVCVSSDGATDGAHIAAARALLATLSFESADLGVAPAPKPTVVAAANADIAVADALDDLLTAIIRAGIDEAEDSPAVKEAIKRITSLREPLPLGLSRFVGRLRFALRTHELTVVARLLDGASRLVGNLRSGTRSEDERVRLSAWLDRGRVYETIHDRVLVEVGREWVDGVEPASIERRYLAHIGDGEVFVEERARDQQSSVGSCPRYVRVGLAEVEQGPLPRRIRLLQYAASPTVREGRFRELGELANTEFEELAFSFRYDLKSFPALTEPFVLVAPNRCEFEGEQLVLIDAESRPLPIAQDGEGTAALLSEIVRARDVLFLAGRVIDRAGALVFVPFSVVSRENGALAFHRLR